MKKIITALDGLHLSQSAIDSTLFIAKRCPAAHIVGVFLDDVLYHGYTFADVVGEGGGISEERIHELNRRDGKTRDSSAAVFQRACGQAGLPCTIHRDRNVAIQELLHESIYADLLIIDSRETFARSAAQEAPAEFLRDLLTDVQCPVLVVPQSYTPVEKLVLLYDGEPSSVHAVKMFSYLLPGLKQAATEVLSIKEGNEPLHLPDGRLMKEFMKRHFPGAAYQVLHGDAEEEIIAHLQRSGQGALVVMGAYRRSRVSRWFKASMADLLLQHLNLPLFISHNK